MADMQMDEAALNAFLRAEFPQIGDCLRVVAVTAAGVRADFTPADMHLRPGGTVSGPSLFMLADVGIYLAILSRIGPVALAVTTGANIDFLRKPAAGQGLICDVRLLKLGQRLAVAEALIFARAPSGDAEEGALARAAMTYSIPPRQDV